MKEFLVALKAAGLLRTDFGAPLFTQFGIVRNTTGSCMSAPSGIFRATTGSCNKCFVW